jgi:hypothetical protein
VIVFGVTAFEKVTEYDVRCDIALSRACRIAASVVLYPFVRRNCAITGTRLVTDTTDITIVIASTVITSSKLKPLARFLLRPVFVLKLFISIGRTCGLPLQNTLCRRPDLDRRPDTDLTHSMLGTVPSSVKVTGVQGSFVHCLFVR